MPEQKITDLVNPFFSSMIIFFDNLILRSNIHSNYYRYNYTFRDHVYTFTNNILRVNLRDIEQDKTVWTVVTIWRDGSSRSISSEDASNILVDEIMISFL